MIYVVFFARGTLLIVFLAAIAGKLHSRSAWASYVDATGSLLGARRARIGAATGVSIEIVTAVCLTINATAFVGLALSLGVMFVFLGVVTSGVIRGVQTACNCFGSDGTTLGRAHVWRNIVLVSVAALGFTSACISRVPPVLGGTSYATAAVLAVISAAVLAMWDDMTFLVLGSD